MLRVGKYIRLVPQPVMLGFVNGLAVAIFLSQLISFQVRETASSFQLRSVYLGNHLLLL
jgi:SulP family sulfate permease